MSPTEVDADSDDSDSSDLSDYEIDSSNGDDDRHHDNDTRICSRNRGAAIEHVEYMTKILSLKSGGNDNATDMSVYRCAKGEEEEEEDDRALWE